MIKNLKWVIILNRNHNSSAAFMASLTSIVRLIELFSFFESNLQEIVSVQKMTSVNHRQESF